MKRKIDLGKNLKIYLGFLKKYKLAAIAIAILVFFFESTKVIDKFLFKIIVDRGTEFSTGSLAQDAFIAVLISLALIFIGVIIFRVIVRWIRMNLSITLDSKMMMDVKKYFFNHIVHLSQNFHNTNKTGSLITRVIRGSYAIERLNDTIVWNFLPLIFQFTIVSISLIYFDFVYVLIMMIIITLFIAYSLIFQNKQKEYHGIMNQEEDTEKAYISDVMMNIDSIKYFGKEHSIKSKFKKLSNNTRIAMARFWSFFKLMDAGQMVIVGLGTFFIVFFAVKEFLAGNITMGSLVFIFTIYGNIIHPLYSFVNGIRNYYRSMIDFNDLFQYGEIKNEIKDSHDAKELKVREGSIEFKDVDFKYKNRWIFKDFNLKINKNEKVALVGHSGCGKTTLIRLLYRLYNLNNGEILIDNKNINSFKQESLRSELSIVPQECILFDDTIYNNIAFSNPKASKEEVIAAIKFAQLDKVIEESPKKEKTIVGERGVKLSGGEKQRVSIARAILANKKILVLDEATSSLDSKTEHDIQTYLRNLMKNRTSIIIAHRLSTIMHADKIVVMDKGKIIEMGNHNNLIRKKGQYKKLWNLQKGGYIK